MKKETNPASFWYGRINKHPEDASRDEVFRIMESFAKQYAPAITEEQIRDCLMEFAGDDSMIFAVAFPELSKVIKELLNN